MFVTIPELNEKNNFVTLTYFKQKTKKKVAALVSLVIQKTNIIKT